MKSSATLFLVLALVSGLVFFPVLGRAGSAEDDLPLVEWHLAFPEDLEEYGSEANTLKGAKTLLGQGLSRRSPKDRHSLFWRSRSAFLRVLSRTSGVSKEERAEAEQYLKALESELGETEVSRETIRLSVVAVGLQLEDEVQELDEERFYELRKKIYRATSDEKKAREEVARARKQCIRRHKVRSKWTGRDDGLVKRAVSEATKVLEKWTDGALSMELARPVIKVPSVVSLRSNSTRARSRMALQTSRTWERGLGPQLARLLDGEFKESWDVLVVFSKYGTRKGELRHASPDEESRRSLAPFRGHVPVAQIGLHSLDLGGKKADGVAGRASLGRRLAEGYYGALREAMIELSGEGQGVKSLLPSPGDAPRGPEEREVFYRGAFSVRLPLDSVTRIRAVSDSMLDAQALLLETGWPELVDRDLRSARPVRSGHALEFTLRRACRTRGIGLVLERSEAGDGAAASHPPLTIELEDGETRYRFAYPSSLPNRAPFHMELPSVVDVRTVRVRRSSEDGAARLLVAEVILFRP